MSEPLRWGILTTGNIARQFARDMAGAERGRIVAVGSRDRGRAAEFAGKFDVPRIHGSYDDLLADPEVEAVYQALPNSMHHEWTIAALSAGKHVLCEKPFAMTAAEAEEMFDVAEAKGVVLIEAFMYRSHPLTAAVVERVRRGDIGRLRMIRTSFCFCADTSANVRFDPDLGGGALMDIGCYCVSFSRFLAQAEPTRIHVVHHRHESAVDDITAGVLHFDDGLIATFTCGMTLHADNTADLCGAEGFIEVPIPWKPPVQGATYVMKRSHPPAQDRARRGPPPPPETIEVNAGKPLYALEADDFAATVRNGAAPKVTRADTIGNMRVLDEMRRQIAAHR